MEHTLELMLTVGDLCIASEDYTGLNTAEPLSLLNALAGDNGWGTAIALGDTDTGLFCRFGALLKILAPEAAATPQEWVRSGAAVFVRFAPHPAFLNPTFDKQSAIEAVDFIRRWTTETGHETVFYQRATLAATRGNLASIVRLLDGAQRKPEQLRQIVSRHSPHGAYLDYTTLESVNRWVFTRLRDVLGISDPGERIQSALDYLKTEVGVLGSAGGGGGTSGGVSSGGASPGSTARLTLALNALAKTPQVAAVIAALGRHAAPSAQAVLYAAVVTGDFRVLRVGQIRVQDLPADRGSYDPFFRELCSSAQGHLKFYAQIIVFGDSLSFALEPGADSPSSPPSLQLPPLIEGSLPDYVFAGGLGKTLHDRKIGNLTDGDLLALVKGAWSVRYGRDMTRVTSLQDRAFGCAYESLILTVLGPLFRCLGFANMDLERLMSDIIEYRPLDLAVTLVDELKFVRIALGAAEERYRIAITDPEHRELVPMYLAGDEGFISHAAMRAQAVLDMERRKVELFRKDKGLAVGGGAAGNSLAQPLVAPAPKALAAAPMTKLDKAYPSGQPAAGSEAHRCSTTVDHFIVMGVHFHRAKVQELIKLHAPGRPMHIYYLLVGNSSHEFRMCVVQTTPPNGPAPCTPEKSDWFKKKLARSCLDRVETAKHVEIPQWF